MNGLLIGIVVFLVLMILAGMYNGLVRCVFGMAALVLSMFLSILMTKVLGFIMIKDGVAQALCFIIVFLAVYIASIVAMVSLNLITSLPVLSTVNRIAGAVLGGVLGILCVFVFFAVVSYLVEQGTAKALYDMIQESELLKGIFDNNFVDMIFREHLWDKIKL